ncbi:MAG: hypothetical protein HY815_24250, partial [Candidatus Riflebacteria bacterium]|nr:hypothetical protein [Candidatus Riflebacteria bacterium]
MLIDSRSLAKGDLEPSLRATLDADLKAAVGFSSRRGDTLSILAAPFHRQACRPPSGGDPAGSTGPAQDETLAVGAAPSRSGQAPAARNSRHHHGNCAGSRAATAPEEARSRSPGLKLVAAAVSLVTANFNVVWVSQVLLFVLVLALFVKHMSPRDVRPEPSVDDRSYPVRLEDVLSQKAGRPRPLPPPESFVGSRSLDLAGSLARADTETLVLVMKTAADPLKELIMSNLDPERAQQVAERVRVPRAVPVCRLEEARRRLSELFASAQVKG